MTHALARLAAPRRGRARPASDGRPRTARQADEEGRAANREGEACTRCGIVRGSAAGTPRTSRSWRQRSVSPSRRNYHHLVISCPACAGSPSSPSPPSLQGGHYDPDLRKDLDPVSAARTRRLLRLGLGGLPRARRARPADPGGQAGRLDPTRHSAVGGRGRRRRSLGRRPRPPSPSESTRAATASRDGYRFLRRRSTSGSAPAPSGSRSTPRARSDAWAERSP